MRGAFAYAPNPAAAELLGSWIHRVALGHRVSGSSFLQGEAGDVDWEVDEDLLRWLSRGSDLSVSTLRSMTIRHRAPESKRTDFAMALGRVFPGCHAYCPRCGLQDRAEHGEVILRQENAGRWRLACARHGLLLDGADDEEELMPPPRRQSRPWPDGRLPVTRERSAPAFAFAFERAVKAAEAGRAPGRLWAVAAPSAFIEIGRTIASLALLRQPYGLRGESAAGALLGGRLASRIGIDFFDPDVIDRVSTQSRVHALMAAALLMLSPAGVARLGVADWQPLRSLHEPKRPPSTLWVGAIAPWDRGALDLLLDFAATWPQRLQNPIEAMLVPRIGFVDG